MRRDPGIAGFVQVAVLGAPDKAGIACRVEPSARLAVHDEDDRRCAASGLALLTRFVPLPLRPIAPSPSPLAPPPPSASVAVWPFAAFAAFAALAALAALAARLPRAVSGPRCGIAV